MKTTKKKYEERKRILKRMMKDQQIAGNAYTMKHIKEISKAAFNGLTLVDIHDDWAL